MQISHAALFAVAVALVSAAVDPAEYIAQIPECAEQCLLGAADGTGCELDDFACQCGEKKAAIAAKGAPCVLKACSATEAMATRKLANEFCAAVLSSGSSSSSAAPESSSSSAPKSSSSAEIPKYTSASSSASGSSSSSAAKSSSSSVAKSSSTEASKSSTTGSSKSSSTEEPEYSYTKTSGPSSTEITAPYPTGYGSNSSIATAASSNPVKTSPAYTASVEQSTGAASHAQVGMGMLMGGLVAAVLL